MLTLELFGILAIAIAGAVLAAMVVAGASVVILAISGLVKSAVKTGHNHESEEAALEMSLSTEA